MAKRPRLNHSSAFKAKVALAAIKGDKTLVEPSEYFDVHARTRLLSGKHNCWSAPPMYLMVLDRGNHQLMSKLSTPR